MSLTLIEIQEFCDHFNATLVPHCPFKIFLNDIEISVEEAVEQTRKCYHHTRSIGPLNIIPRKHNNYELTVVIRQ